METENKYFVDILRERIYPIVNGKAIINMQPMEFTLGYTK